MPLERHGTGTGGPESRNAGKPKAEGRKAEGRRTGKPE